MTTGALAGRMSAKSGAKLPVGVILAQAAQSTTESLSVNRESLKKAITFLAEEHGRTFASDEMERHMEIEDILDRLYAMGNKDVQEIFAEVSYIPDLSRG